MTAAFARAVRAIEAMALSQLPEIILIQCLQ